MSYPVFSTSIFNGNYGEIVGIEPKKSSRSSWIKRKS